MSQEDIARKAFSSLLPLSGGELQPANQSHRLLWSIRDSIESQTAVSAFVHAHTGIMPWLLPTTRSKAILTAAARRTT